MATVSRILAAEVAIGAMIDESTLPAPARDGASEADSRAREGRLRRRRQGAPPRHRRDVALKCLTRSPDDGSGKRRRRAHALHRDLLREACYLVACRGHPSVVGLHGIARDPHTGQCSLVLEHVGQSLGHVLRGRRRPFAEEETRRVMRQLLSGAGRIHERGIVHRDIMPSNILVGGKGMVKICDLGLAVSMASATPPRGRVGTLWYMAPEMLLGKPDYNELMDAWSLGCVMAELLAGEPMFPGHSATDQFLRIFRVLGGPCMASTPLVAAGQKPMTRRGGSQLHELFPEERLSRDRFEVLQGLDPGKRLPAVRGHRRPFLSRVACMLYTTVVHHRFGVHF